ncbi:MAG: helix-turn-helix domain-containing protein, partial [Nanoarchaeota archaeon]
MLVKQELLGKIRDYFDLNIYETKVWLALLGKGVASAGQIAEISRVPRSRTYDVLESLEKKGFAIVKLGKPVKYIGVKPHMVLEKLKNNVKQEAEEKMVTLSNLRSTDEFAKLEEYYREGLNP